MKDSFDLDDDFKTIIQNSLNKLDNNSSVEKINQITTGWTNIVYKAVSNIGIFYFRFPRDKFWERTIVKDYEFAKYIQSKTSFDTVNLILDYDKNRPFSIHKGIEGKPLAEVMDNLSENEIINISKDISLFLKELHELEFEKENIFIMSKNIGLDLQGFVDELLKKHISKKDIEFWKNENFKYTDLSTCLVHGDFNSSNILLDANNNFKAVIDFGFGGFGNIYQDVSRIIGRCPQSFKKHIISSYESLTNQKLDIHFLEKNISIWNKIDNAYINYMKKIGIYS